MKILITAEDVRQAASRGEKLLVADSSTIVTPAARDAAKELGIELAAAKPAAPPVPAEPAAGSTLPSLSAAANPPVPADSRTTAGPLSGADIEGAKVIRPMEAVIGQVVAEVVSRLAFGVPAELPPGEEAGPQGLRLVRGNQAVLAPMPSWSSKEAVLGRRLFGGSSSTVAAWLIDLDNRWILQDAGCDEIAHVVTGVINVRLDGRVLTAVAGDTLLFPAGIQAEITAAGEAARLLVVSRAPRAS